MDFFYMLPKINTNKSHAHKNLRSTYLNSYCDMKMQLYENHEFLWPKNKHFFTVHDCITNSQNMCSAAIQGKHKIGQVASKCRWKEE